jgi:hypothetical protein
MAETTTGVGGQCAAYIFSSQTEIVTICVRDERRSTSDDLLMRHSSPPLSVRRDL